jgi:hypothetical protein
MKFPSTTAFKALSDIKHHRYNRSLDLPRKSEIPCKRPLLGNLINCSSEISGFLPGD